MKILILGAGPAGLAFANRICQLGIDDVLILEKEAEAGGLCRSKLVDGFSLDIGGGHFLDVRNHEVTDFLFKFMSEDEWNTFERDSRIELNGGIISYPIEANIWQLGIDEQVAYLKSIACAGCNSGTEKPEGFVDWIYWKLGNEIADNYMIPYNQKIYCDHLEKLGTYWLEKLPNVSFEDTLRSCLEKKAYGRVPGHAKFFYPKKHGYGELWLRMADALGSRVKYNQSVSGIDFEKKRVFTEGGDSFDADLIVTTIPWKELTDNKGMPSEIDRCRDKLKNNSIAIKYVEDKLDIPCHWIYCPDVNKSYHRILVRHNFLPGSKGYFTETNTLVKIESGGNEKLVHVNEYAYPLNTIEKPQAVSDLLGWAKKHGVIGLGRWGEHQHYNSDVTVEKAIKLAEEVAKGV